MKRIATMAVLLAATLSSAVHALEMHTATGPVDIKSTPKRVAVYDVAAVDTLTRLGVEIAGVPENLYLPQLTEAAKGSAVVGSLFEPDLEALSALAPDLIIIGERTAAQRKTVEQLAPTIDMTLTGTDLIPQARARIVDYGKLFDREQAAAEAAAELDQAVESARQGVAGKGNALILMTSGSKISVYGEDSRFGWLYRELGIKSAVDSDAAAKHGEAVSFEFVREINPDWLIVVDRAAATGSGEANAKATLDNELVRGTKAWNSGHVVYLPAAEFYIAAGGASSTVRVLNAVTEGFKAH